MIQGEEKSVSCTRTLPPYHPSHGTSITQWALPPPLGYSSHQPVPRMVWCLWSKSIYFVLWGSQSSLFQQGFRIDSHHATPEPKVFTNASGDTPLHAKETFIFICKEALPSSLWFIDFTSSKLALHPVLRTGHKPSFEYSYLAISALGLDPHDKVSTSQWAMSDPCPSLAP